jgi:hypothetical protein
MKEKQQAHSSGQKKVNKFGLDNGNSWNAHGQIHSVHQKPPRTGQTTYPQHNPHLVLDGG